MNEKEEKEFTKIAMEAITHFLHVLPYESLDDVIKITKAEKAIRMSRGDTR